MQGRNLANPTSMLLSSVMMLRHLGLESHANQIGDAVLQVIEEGKVKTADMGGSNTTTEFADAIMSKL